MSENVPHEASNRGTDSTRMDFLHHHEWREVTLKSASQSLENLGTL